MNKRQLIWRHNSFLGHAAMIQKTSETILQSLTATDEAKALADQINALSYKLSRALKTRKELP